MRTGTQLYRHSVHSYVIYAEIELQVDITELLVVMGAKDSLGIENYHYIHTYRRSIIDDRFIQFFKSGYKTTSKIAYHTASHIVDSHLNFMLNGI